VIERGKEEIKQTTKIQEETAAEVSEEEIGIEVELPNFFELLLGKGTGEISEGKPVCIIVEKTKENLEELIAVLCRDIYREKMGGKPTPIRKKTVEALRREWDSLVQRRIIIIEEVEKVNEELFEMLNGFFSQDIGYLILVTSQPFRLENEIRKVEPSKIITVGGLPPEMEGKKEEILRSARGKESVSVGSFGEEFKRSAENLEEELIRKYLNSEKAPDELKYNWDRLVASSPDGDEDASPLHSAVKAFVWVYEWKKHEKRITPKLEASQGEDVRVEEEAKNYEIETLFGVEDVRSKLTKKIKKYQGRKGEKVCFVLRNLDILRNLSLLSSFRKDWSKVGYNVEFFGLDLDKEELVPLEEFVKLVKLSIKTRGS
jgi:hypothetical protein